MFIELVDINGIVYHINKDAIYAFTGNSQTGVTVYIGGNLEIVVAKDYWDNWYNNYMVSCY